MNNTIIDCYYILADACNKADLTIGNSELDAIMNDIETNNNYNVYDQTGAADIMLLKRIVSTIRQSTTDSYSLWCCDQVMFNLNNA